MASKNRIFQYPVLRGNSKDYVDNSILEALCTVEIVGDSIKDSVKLNYEIVLRNIPLSLLVDDKSAAVFISVYCSETLFKTSIELEQLQGEIILPRGSIVGNLEVEPMLIATKDIDGFRPAGINLEYGEVEFDIEKGSPLGIGERDVFPISFVRRSFQDLIRVQTAPALHKDEYEISLASNVITINMGTNVRQAYELMSSDVALRPFLFISIYKDTFVEAVNAIVGGEDVDEFAWAQKLQKTFETVGIDLKEEADFSKINGAVLRLLGEKGIERMISNVG